MTYEEKLAQQAIKLENTLFLRWFECKRNHASMEYVERLSQVRHKAFARVFRRQVER